MLDNPVPGHGGTDSRDILITQSLDRGNTWSLPSVVNSDSWQDAQSIDNQHPAIAVDNSGTVHVFWYAQSQVYTGSGIRQHYYHAQWDGFHFVGTRPAFSSAEPITSTPMYFDMSDTRLRTNFGFYNTAATARHAASRVYCAWSDHRVGQPDPDAYVATVVQGTIPTDVAIMPRSGAALLSSNPNPFNPETVLAFQIPSGLVSLRSYDPAGRLVRTLLAGTQLSAGLHQERWNGRDDRGHVVASGVYVAELRVDQQSATQKLVVTR
jgi:hypothetical protein